jgi:hypothetical protein
LHRWNEYIRTTTLPFNFSALIAGEQYYISQPLPLPYRIIHIYALAEPNPQQLAYVMLLPYTGQLKPVSGQPGGPTIFDSLLTRPQIQLGRVPTDMDVDIEIATQPNLMCYFNPNGATGTSAMCLVKVVLQ